MSSLIPIAGRSLQRRVRGRCVEDADVIGVRGGERLNRRHDRLALSLAELDVLDGHQDIERAWLDLRELAGKALLGEVEDRADRASREVWIFVRIDAGEDLARVALHIEVDEQDALGEPALIPGVKNRNRGLADTTLREVDHRGLHRRPFARERRPSGPKRCG